MLVQDMLSGQLHEVPDHVAGAPTHGWPDPQLYGLGEVHDAFGNSLGLFFLPKLIQKAVGVVRKILPGGSPAPAPPAAAASAAPGCPPCPVCRMPYPIPSMPMPPGFAPGYPFPRRRRRRR